MKQQSNRLKYQNGSSLVAVFWLIGVLGLAMLSVTRFVALDSKWIVGIKSAAIAENHAETGLAIASHPQIAPGDPLLTWTGDNESYVADISWEEALIPLNHILFGNRKGIAARLFENWGMDPQESASVVDAMLDWTDENDLTSLHGAEADQYAETGKEGFPYNRPFQTLEEVELVLGMDRVAALKPDWKEYFTLWSTGQIDINEANSEIIVAATGIEDFTRAEEFVQSRDGEDGIKGNEDDNRFATLAEAVNYFALSPIDGGSIVTVRGSTRRITSTGSLGNYIVKISETRRGRQLLWRMEY